VSDNGKQDAPSLPVRAAAVQMNSGDNVNQNLELAARLLGEAAADGCALAVLPENFPFMGARGKDKLQHAEEPGAGPIQDFLADTARNNNLWIISGSIPLRSSDPGRCYGATLVVDADGNTQSCYRKIHLFDVDLPDRGERYRESASMMPGDNSWFRIHLSGAWAFQSVTICVFRNCIESWSRWAQSYCRFRQHLHLRRETHTGIPCSGPARSKISPM